MKNMENKKDRYMKYPKGSVGYTWGYWGSDFKLKKPIKKRPNNPNELL